MTEIARGEVCMLHLCSHLYLYLPFLSKLLSFPIILLSYSSQSTDVPKHFVKNVTKQAYMAYKAFLNIIAEVY